MDHDTYHMDDRIVQQRSSVSLPASDSILLSNTVDAGFHSPALARREASVELDKTTIEAQIRFWQTKLEQSLEIGTGATLRHPDRSFEEDVTPTNLSHEPAIPEMCLVDWAAFKNRNWCHCPAFQNWLQRSKEDRPYHAIEVLEGPPKYYWQRREFELERKMSGYGPSYGRIRGEVDRNGEQSSDHLSVDEGMPSRIRINSRPIMTYLGYVSGWSKQTQPMVFRKPYKILIYYDASIRHHLANLQKKYGKYRIKRRRSPLDQDINSSERSIDTLTEESPSIFQIDSNDVESWDIERNNVDLKDCAEALEDFECLVRFMDIYIAPTVQQYQSNDLQKIYFRDLWHLFKPGEEVVVYDMKGDNDGVQTLQKPRFKSDRVASPRNFERNSVWTVIHAGQGRRFLSPTSISSNRPAQPGESSPFRVLCYRIDYDGQGFGPAYRTFAVNPFEGERDVHSLTVVPLRLVPDSGRIRKELLQLGRKFMSLTNPTHQLYTGPTATRYHNGELCELGDQVQHIDGHVMIDVQAAIQDDPRWTLDPDIPEPLVPDRREVVEDYPVVVWKDWEQKSHCCVSQDLIHNDAEIDEALYREHVNNDKFMSNFKCRNSNEEIDGNHFTENELILLPRQICGFDLQRRTFALFFLDKLRPVVQTQNWDDLKLRAGHKEMILAQSQTHFQDKRPREELVDQQHDIVHGKGKGLVILLHGVPGVGKTSTAECIAAKLNKPLFPLTCGDLGVTASEVDRVLTEVFARAQRWDCVLLLDEADVFLAARNKTDIKRNALVSVFLRVLDYYSGLLFMTTNRVGSLDEAFKSRIHSQLYYPPLDIKQTLSIWRLNMERLKDRKGESLQIDARAIKEYAVHHFENNEVKWNGRQIRNAFQTAAALAEFDAQNSAADEHSSTASGTPVARLDVKYFEKVAEATASFDEYLTSTLRHSQSHIANLERLRDDQWSPRSERSQQQQPSSPAQAGRYPRTGGQARRFSGPQAYAQRFDADDGWTPQPPPQTRPMRNAAPPAYGHGNGYVNGWAAAGAGVDEEDEEEEGDGWND
ncbi:MAG: hypothetical protein M1820_006916 [Bogoriella megaspora]|nr:MAG: hypothetical protein M1820_006916 [Bogoriella megaspora]